MLAAVLLLSGCQTAAPAHQAAASGAQAVLATAPQLRQDAFKGIYEITSTADGASVFVASINGFDRQNAGFVHRLDARTLQTVQTIQVPRRAFALGLNNTTQTLYVGNTMEGSLSVVDAGSGIVKGVIQLAQPQKNDQGEESFAHTRKVIADETHNRVFVTSPGQPGLVWIVDGATNTLTHTITSDGIWTAGAAYDPLGNRLYVSQGGVHEILAIDPDSGKVVQALSTGDSKANTAEASRHFFINLAIDVKGQRLFAADGNTNQLYVADIASGQFVRTVPVGGVGTLDVIYNARRNEVVASHRGATHGQPDGTGGVTVFDGSTFAVKRRFELPVHPNSLALSPDGQTLYVTVKAPHGEQHAAFRKDGLDSVVRIDLR
ncbi:YncE family protein [Corticibacter populi]|uniref:YncE family protein n=2 Tax=Corticibacter populi TaxID=1550736 RepID=A0A3M6R0U8_9BURK|nr:YncE family protein [Corticibacter populi]